MKKLAVLVAVLAVLAWGTGVRADVLSGGSGYLVVSNDAGRFYDGGLVNTDPLFNQFYFNYTGGGGGLNQLKLNSTGASSTAQNLTGTAASGSYSGSFWVPTSGGKGGNDDIILCVALTGTISSSFSLSIISNGYVVTPDSTTRPTVTAADWETGVVNEVFYGSDFLYGPQATRPASTYQALYNGQGAATGMLMFIDLGVANRTGDLSDQVLFNITGLYDGNVLAFSAYAYDLILGNTGSDLIGWTTATATTGYTVTGAGAAAVPVPPSILLMIGGLGGLGLMRKKWFGCRG